MALRRLALAITLLAAPAAANDPDEYEIVAAEGSSDDGSERTRGTAEDDLVLWRDGTIAGSVRGYLPWSLLRLVLPDVGVEREPTWIEPPRGGGHGGGDLLLSTLRGAAVLDATGRFAGVVQRCLVSLEHGRVLAIELAGGEVVPWSMLSVPERATSPLVLSMSADADWMRGAPRSGDE